jgi:endo-1,4-beta-xylanase
MKETNFYTWKPLLYMMFLVLICSTPNLSAQKICIDKSTDQIIGEQDGYRYELWNQNSQGNACMTLDEGALFSGEWRGIENYLARRGLNYNQTKKHQEIGEFFTNYKCDYKPSFESGNSYLSVYGWTVEPLIEYYIIEDWRNWAPYMSPDATFKGSFEANDSIYDVYEKTRVEKPSIVGITTFQQYFSIRRGKRSRGTINISDHFNMWEKFGMKMGKLHEVSFVVEGFKSSGSFEFKELDVFVSRNNSILK